MNRRGFLRGILAGAAISTGLGRYRLELVDEAHITFKGVPIYEDATLPGLEALVGDGPIGIINDSSYEWWRGARPRVEQSPDLEQHLAAVMESAWRDVARTLDPPDFIYVDDRTLRAMEIYHA